MLSDQYNNVFCACRRDPGVHRALPPTSRSTGGTPGSTPSPKKRQLPAIPLEAQKASRDRGTSLCLCICQTVSLSISACVSDCLSSCVSTLSSWVSASISVRLSACLSLPMCMSPCVSVRLPACLSLPVYLTVCLPVSLPVCLSPSVSVQSSLYCTS